MDEAETFMILDLESNNALASFGSLHEAEGAFVAMLGEQPSRAGALALVGIDKEGFPVDSRVASDFQPQ
jgi:hypothetical protein